MLSKDHIPNALTLSRYAVIPLLLLAWYSPAPYGLWLPFILVALACLSDFLDGYLARKWQVQSELGRLLDPNADKLLIAVALLLLASDGRASLIAVAVILCRELFVSGLREFTAERQLILHVTTLAKWKTTMQMLAVLCLMLALAFQSALMQLLGGGLLWLAAALTLITGWDYARKTFAHLKT